MSGYNRHNVVSNCLFQGTGANCVALFGLRSCMKCPESWDAGGSNLVGTCSDKTPGPATQDYPAYCLINNNLMDTLGVFEKQVSG